MRTMNKGASFKMTKMCAKNKIIKIYLGYAKNLTVAEVHVYTLT